MRILKDIGCLAIYGITKVLIFPLVYLATFGTKVVECELTFPDGRTLK